MDTTFNVNYNLDIPRLGFTLGNLYNSIVDNIEGSVDDTVIPITTDTQACNPDSVMFDGSGWRVWKTSSASYQPIGIIVGGVKFSASPTANRTQLLQTQSGIIALLDDVYGIRPSITFQEGLVSVDWSKASSFVVILSSKRQTALYMTNSNPGMRITILLVNSGTSQTVTWDSSIKWQGGTAPSVPTSKAGSSNTQLVTLRNVNGTIYAEYTNQGARAYTTNDISKAVPSLNTGGLWQ